LGPVITVIYISYDGASEPLGRSQVVAYLRRLTPKARVTLISFEKPGEDPKTVARELAQAGIEWVPLRYHRRPPVLSTLWDVARGALRVRKVASRYPPDILHARSYVPALIALCAQRLGVRARFLFDIRGFWRDERLDAAFWARDGAIDRAVRHCEQSFFARSDAIVTLTEASVPQIQTWLDGREPPVEVIPTCADVERFASVERRPDGPHAVWSGSLGAWDRFDLALALADALGLPLTVLTRQRAEAHALLEGRTAQIMSVAPEAMPRALFAGDVGLCLVRPSFSKIASAPTRLAEFLAAGMPVVVTAGVGDLEAIVQRHRVGVTLQGESDAAIRGAIAQLHALMADSETSERCRDVARQRFHVSDGAQRYAALYSRLAGTDPGLGISRA
jgi:glycosyltransferase involved in cell wall biosynthesis